MKLDKIISAVQNNELKTPLRAGVEKQTVLRELKSMNADPQSDFKKVGQYLKSHFTSEDAQALEQLVEG